VNRGSRLENCTNNFSGFRNINPRERVVLLDEKQPLLLQLGTQQGQFNTLADSDILDCYVVMEYTLQ